MHFMNLTMLIFSWCLLSLFSGGCSLDPSFGEFPESSDTGITDGFIGDATGPTLDAMVTDMAIATPDVVVPDAEPPPDAACTPVAETCNGIDDDCDSLVDEDFPTLGTACQEGTGLCRQIGIIICDGDNTTTCSAVPSEAMAETCDSLDNDCDGTIDEGLGLNQACTAGVGTCTNNGVTVCDDDGNVICNAVQRPAAEERCDNLDNDCDGQVDESFNVGDACQSGAGACIEAGTFVCTANQDNTICDARPRQPGVETCDDEDNDCDGTADEGFNIGAPCSVGVGACTQPGVFVCAQGGESTCDAIPGVPANSDMCNDQEDNDCDGTIDEGCNCEEDIVCGPEAVGVCQRGTQRCQNGVLGACEGAVLPTDERCDGLDNDCDGRTDETFPNLGDACSNGAGQCRTAGIFVCDGEEGTRCNAEPGQPQAEVCNNLDDDCNGLIDDHPSVGNQCEVGVGACQAEGFFFCRPDQGPAPICGAIPRDPIAERCDDVDNDCDGLVDEIFNLGDVCSEGVGACEQDGVFICGDNQQARCNAEPEEPTVERCGDTIDNDCDGQVDEGFNVGAACTVGIGACANTGETICNENADGLICGVQAGEAVAEVCNTLDDDCDGRVDEDLGLGNACTAGEGACQNEGELICGNDNNVVCSATPGVPGGAELCNTIDDDCDGLVDESLGLGDACTLGVGECETEGTQVCNLADSSVTCDAQVALPQDEQCDSLDNDCDGSIDETYDLGSPCVEGIGRCQNQGQTVCAEDGNGVSCNAEPSPPQAELCNTFDDDCDGIIDEAFFEDGLGDDCANGVGACSRRGTLICSPNEQSVVCDAVPGDAIPELCDELDNDCDGQVDERFFSLGTPCTVGVGACRNTGVTECNENNLSTIQCSVAPLEPTIETCDSIDNDCDEVTDEDYPTLGLTCRVGQGVCQNEGEFICTPAGDGVACSVDPLPPPDPPIEFCDGLDNDCDGTPDDSYPTLGQPCNVGVGICVTEGVNICNPDNQQSVICDAVPSQPADELCANGDDEDCDGQVDEDNCLADADGDQVFGDDDNCPSIPNPRQADVNGNGVGDVCDGLTPIDDQGNNVPNADVLIGAHPVTVAAYRACMMAGVAGCTVPQDWDPLCTWTENPGAMETFAITCVTVSQMEAYASWVGGQIITEEIWRRLVSCPDPNAGCQPYLTGANAPGCNNARYNDCPDTDSGPGPLCVLNRMHIPSGFCDRVGNVSTYIAEAQTCINQELVGHLGGAYSASSSLMQVDQDLLCRTLNGQAPRMGFWVYWPQEP